MATSCPVCGAEQAPGARFCASCGAPQNRPWDEQQERRVVTVLFADLAGSTALGERLDPEEVRDVQAELFELLNTQVERFGGITEKFVGDAVLAVFGIPQAHEDDPERAVRAALAARETFGPFAESVRSRYGKDVGLRIGVNTGEVVSGREAAARGELVASGDAVNVAARLQQGAEPGEILVGRRTHLATSRTVSYGPRRDLDAKGKSEPVPAWDVRGVEAQPAAKVTGLRAPLVGREEELIVLEAVATRVRRERIPQLVTLFGPAGVGKSRLVGELLERLPEARVLQGRCLPYGEGVTYWPLAEAAKADAQVLDTDPVEVALGKLRSAVESVVTEGADEVLDAVAWTIGFSVPGSSLASADPQAVGPRLAQGWQRYVGALGGGSLTVVVIEDVHWASAALLDLVEHLVDMVFDACVLLVCTARPEFLEGRPTWGAGKQNVTALSLTPLSPDESERLVSSLLGEARVPADVRRPLLASAEGNPFFLEEMLQMLIDEGALERQNGGWTATGRLAKLRVPDSVHGVIAARLDLLEPEARDALRRCAVVGRVFWPSAVGVEEAAIAALARTGLVSPHPSSVMAGLREFSFKHALTRDVAYGSLPRPERRELHRRVAEWIQSVAPDRDVETAELVGYHYREAIAYGEDDPEVARRAHEVLLVAGRAATRRAAFSAARDQLEGALALAAADDRRAESLIGLVEIDVTEARWKDARAHLDLADRLPGIAPTLRSELLGWRSRASWLTGRWDEALAAAEGAVAELAGLPESVQLARALARRSQIEMLRNRPVGLEHAREAIAVAERVGDGFAAVNSAVNLFTVEGSQFGIAPDPDEVLAISERAQAIGAHEEAVRAVVNFVWSATGYVHVDRIEATVEAARDGLLLPAGIGGYFELSIAWMIYSPTGRWAEADELAERVGPDSLSATSELLWRPLTGLLALRRGDLETAGERLADLHELALATGEAQRTVPSACAVCPWLQITGQQEELPRVVAELLESVDGEWPVVISMVPVVRALAAAGELETLEALLDSVRAFRVPTAARLPVTISTGEALLSLARGSADDAVELLRTGVATDEALGLSYDATCLKVELARALAAGGHEDETARVRAEVERYLAPLACVNPY